MRNALIVAAALALAAVLFVVLRPDGGSEAQPGTTTAPRTAPGPPQQPPPPSPPPPAQVRLVVRNGEPVGGVRKVTISKGRRVVLVVTSDVADEVHLHGYNLKRDVTPGRTTRLPFTATIVGTVEVELESHSLPLARITTNP